MNILVLCLSEGIGGLELYALREIRHFLSLGNKCIPVVSKRGVIYKELMGDGVNVESIKVTNRSVPLIAAWKLAALIDKYNIDIVHIHWSKDVNLAVLAKQLSNKNINLVYSRHMGITRSKRDLYHALLYRSVDKFIASTNLVREEAYKFLPISREKIDRLYIGVTEPKEDAARCNEIFESGKFIEREFNIALFGRIEHGKGQHVLVDALINIIKIRGLDVSATIVGQIMDQEYAARLVSKIDAENLSSNIQFKGFMKNPIECMSCFDVIVLTTYNETFGLVLVEAMRAGVAVIGTNAGGVPEIISNEKTGLLYEPGSPDGLAACLLKLIENHELRKTISASGKKYADEMFSEKAHFAELVKRFLELHNGKVI